MILFYLRIDRVVVVLLSDSFHLVVVSIKSFEQTKSIE